MIMQEDRHQPHTRPTPGISMGPIDTYRSLSLSAPDKKAFSATYSKVDEGVLRCWGLRRYEVGGVEVIGWEVGMGPA